MKGSKQEFTEVVSLYKFGRKTWRCTNTPKRSALHVLEYLEAKLDDIG